MDMWHPTPSREGTPPPIRQEKDDDDDDDDDTVYKSNSQIPEKDERGSHSINKPIFLFHATCSAPSTAKRPLRRRKGATICGDRSKWDQSKLLRRQCDMGISSLPNPSESVLALVLFNVALALSILKELLRSALHLLRLSSPPSAEMAAGDAAEPGLGERFRKRCRPFRFVSARERRRAADCRVCLGRFEPESVVNRLACGHLFHTACLETWFEYHHATCPLCRTHVVPGEEQTASLSSPSFA